MKYIGIFLLLCTCSSMFARDINSIYPYPKASWNKTGEFVITGQTKIVTPDAPTPMESRAIAALQAAISPVIGSTLSLIKASAYSGSGGILIGEFATNSLLASHLQPVMAPGEVMPPAQGYILDITSTEAIIAGSDTDGLVNAVRSFVQLFPIGNNTIFISAGHVWDYPDYPARWVFSQHNLLVPSQLSQLEAIADTMALYRLNGLQQNDFKYAILQTQGANYFQNVDSLKAHLLQNTIEIIPGVIGLGWSSGILYNDPNLAEGVPATSTYYMEADTGRLLPDSRVNIPNGGFESVDLATGKFLNWSFYDGANLSTFIDNNVRHSGSYSARCTNFSAGNPNGNCRFVEQFVPCNQNKYYSMSAWIKTSNLNGGDLQMLALDASSGKQLTFTALAIPSTADWTRVEVNFNTLSSNSLNLYIGLWGGVSGTVWFDDFQIKEAGMSSVLRRGGCPLTVQNKHTGKIYTEGTDFMTIIDPWVDSHKDSYFPNHTPPTFKRLASGTINNGDTMVISYYHPFAAVSDNSGNGSVMACVSEDTLWKIIGDQLTRVNNLYHPGKFFMGHDEIRNMNRDKICRDKNLSPASLLSDNMTRCHDLIRQTSPASDILMWSDMVDPLHNAVNNYYLVNGDLSGDWKNIPKDITIVNWNGGNQKNSLKFFHDSGFKQITSPYYDAGNTSTIRSWRVAQEGISNIRGMMYTTWAQDYNFLRAFAYYAWGAGPVIYHTPLDTSVLRKDAFDVTANILSDPYDGNDQVTDAEFNLVDSTGAFITNYFMANQGGTIFTANVPNIYQKGFRYYISAKNQQGITRKLPVYFVLPSVLAAPQLISPANKSADSLVNVAFKWNSVASAKHYRIQISASQNFLSTPWDSTVADTTVLFKNIPVSKNSYYWRVQASNDEGSSVWSLFRTFKVLCVPPIPQLLYPIDSAMINGDTVTLRWSTSSCDASFDIQVSNDSVFSTTLVDQASLGNASYSLHGLSAGKYFWHVRSSGGPFGTTAWSALKRYIATSSGVFDYASGVLSLRIHPNPLSSATQIDVHLPASGFISLKIFDVLGREIETILSKYLESGNHTISFDAKNISAGSYILELRSKDEVLSREIEVVK